jgi:selenocysteine lyase/cysteine desulfurase
VSDFSILDHLAFFNHAGVAPISPAAAKALRGFADQAETRAYIDSGWYRRIKQVKQAAARLINARGHHEIAFVPNTSAGLAIVARGLEWIAGDNVVISAVEYPANRYPWEDLKRFGVELIEVAPQPDGRIDVEDVVDAITNRTRVVAISHVQYASGFCIDLKPISDMVHSVPGSRGLLCVDAIQSVGAMPVDVQAMGIDFLAADGHKWMLSPEGCGIFYCREDLIQMLHPPVVGWMNMINATNYGDYQFEFCNDARRFEPGSYNVPGILALGASIDMLLQVGLDNVWARIEVLTARLCEGLKSKGYHIFSPRQDGERSGIVIFDSPAPDNQSADKGPMQQIVSDLENRNIIIVVREGRMRASPHYYNTEQQIDELIKALP